MANASTLTPARRHLDRVRRYIERHEQIRSGDRVLVSVSGGSDSTCLLLTLASLTKRLSFDLRAAHFDHALRGRRAAAAERRFVEGLCNGFKVPLSVGSGDVRTHARKQRRSIEDAARELRYGFLAETARTANCNVIATGHTKDDQAETLLLHLIRGSGLRGLAGMSPISDWPFARDGAEGFRLIRPLLDSSRSETERCCIESGVEPIDDPSNKSTEFLRNRVRHELLPVLQSYNPRVVDALAGLAESTRSDLLALEQAADELVDERSGRAVVNRRRFADVSNGVQAHVIRRAYSLVTGDARELGKRHIDAILAAAAGPTGSSLHLPRGVRVEARRETIVFSQGLNLAAERLPSRAVQLSVPGMVEFGPWRFEAKVVPTPSRLEGGQYTAFFDPDALACDLRIRRRRDGDRFQPLGMKSSKKLQDFFVDTLVPRDERDATPLLASERGIAWVVGQRIAEWAKVPAGTRLAVRVRAKSVAK